MPGTATLLCHASEHEMVLSLHACMLGAKYLVFQLIGMPLACRGALQMLQVTVCAWLAKLCSVAVIEYTCRGD